MVWFLLILELVLVIKERFGVTRLKSLGDFEHLADLLQLLFTKLVNDLEDPLLVHLCCFAPSEAKAALTA